MDQKIFWDRFRDAIFKGWLLGAPQSQVMFFFRLLVARQPKGQNLSKVCQKISLNLNFLVKSQKFGKSHPTALPARKRCFGLLASILDCVHSRELSFESWPQMGLNFFPSILWPIRTIFERMGAVFVSRDTHFLTFLSFSAKWQQAGTSKQPV